MEYKVTNEHINEYISGELAGNNLIEFEKLLAIDKALQERIKVHQQIDSVLSENYYETNRFNKAEYENEKERLNPIFNKMNQKYFTEGDSEEKKISDNKIKVEKKSDENTQENVPIIRRLFPLVALAAAAALLLFVFNPFASNLSPSQLADQYFKPYNTSSFMGEPGNTDTPKTPRELLAQGSQQYEGGKIEQAIQSFKQVAANSSLQYQNEANWNLAICYLKLNQPEKAKQLLMELQTVKKYSADTKVILKQLE